MDKQRSSGTELSPSAGTIGALTLSSGNTITYTLSNAIAVSSVLLSASNTLDASASNYGISVSGNWVNAGAFTPRSGTVTFWNFFVVLLYFIYFAAF